MPADQTDDSKDKESNAITINIQSSLPSEESHISPASSAADSPKTVEIADVMSQDIKLVHAVK